MSERPTPQALAVCSLISQYSDPASPLNQDGTDGAASGDRATPEQKRNERAALGDVLERSVTIEWKEGGSVMSLFRWIRQVRDKLGGTESFVLKTLYLSLERAASSIESLTELVSIFQSSVSKGIVDPVSAHGVFVRQVSLGFEELSFESVAILCQALREELEQWAVSYHAVDDPVSQQDMQTRSRSRAPSASVSASNSPQNVPSSLAWSTSREQVERMVRKECLVLIANLDAVPADDYAELNEHGPVSGSDAHGYEATDERIKSCLDDDPEIPLLYFWRYLNCLRHGEKAGAIESLHAYLDHAMMEHSDILQFSALLLASTHANFGDWHIAEMAVEEAVKVAQQSKDACCVAFALGWLAIISRRLSTNATSARSNTDAVYLEGEMLQRCAARAMQGNLRPLQSGANMLLAQYCLQNPVGWSSAGNNAPYEGEVTATGVAWSNLLDAMTTVPQPSSSANARNGRIHASSADASALSSSGLPKRLDRPTAFSNGYTGQQAMDDLSQQRLVAARLWDVLENPIMSNASSLAALECHPDLSLNDTILAVQNIARTALYGCVSDRLGVIASPTPGQSQTPGDACVYAIAIQTLFDLRRRYRYRRMNGEAKLDDTNDPCHQQDQHLEQPFYRSVLLLLHEWAVRRGDLEDANALQVVLLDFLYPRMGAAYQAYSNDIKLQRVYLLTRKGCWDEARNILSGMIQEAAGVGASKHTRARLLLHFASLQLESSSSGMPALKPVLQVLAQSKDDEMDGIHAAALAMLAKIFLRLGKAKRALALLNACVGQLTQHAHVSFQAEALLTHAMCYMQLANPKNTKWMQVTGERDGQPSKQHVRSDRMNAVSYLKRAQRLFERCHDMAKLKAISYYQARLYHDLGMLKERDDASDRFAEISSYLERSVNNQTEVTPACILDSLSVDGLTSLVARKLPMM